MFRSTLLLALGLIFAPAVFAGGSGSADDYQMWKNAQQQNTQNPSVTQTGTGNSLYDFANQYNDLMNQDDPFHVVYRPMWFSPEGTNTPPNVEIIEQQVDANGNYVDGTSDAPYAYTNTRSYPPVTIPDSLGTDVTSNTGNSNLAYIKYLQDPAVPGNQPSTYYSRNYNYVDEFPSATNLHTTRNSLRRIITDEDYNTWYRTLKANGDYLSRDVSYYENYILRERARQYAAQNRASKLLRAYGLR